MARTLNELVNAQDAQHVQPLLANESFRRRADVALANADDAQKRAAAAAAADEDFSGIVRMFASAKSALAAISKKFPESARFTDEAAKQIDLAMQVAVGEAPVQESAPGTTPSQGVSQSLRSQAPATPQPSGAQSPFLNRR